MRYLGGSRADKGLKYPREFYVPSVSMMSRNLSDKEIRAEYSRLRSIARKRLERFEGTEWVDTQVYKFNHGKYIPVKDIKNKTQMVSLLAEVARFVTAESGSVSGLARTRSRNVATLHEHGYTFVTRTNYRDFADFMEEYRIRRLNRIYDSERVAETFEAAEKKGIPPRDLYRDFEFWLENRDALREMKKISSTKPHSAEDYKKAIIGE